MASNYVLRRLVEDQRSGCLGRINQITAKPCQFISIGYSVSKIEHGRRKLNAQIYRKDPLAIGAWSYI